MRKAQFNTRIPPPLKRATRIVAAALNWSAEELTEVALASAMGSKDNKIKEKQRQIQQTAEQLSLSFSAADLQLDGFAV